MKNKYILIISAVYPPEPIVSSKLSSDLYLAYKEDGKDVKVLHPEPSRPNGFKFDEGHHSGEDEVILHSYTCPKSSLLGRMRESWSFGKACKKYIKEHHSEIDCIYANTWPMFSQKAIVKAAKKYGIPCIIHVQDVYPESLTNKMPPIVGKIVHTLILPIDKYILRNCTKVVAISGKMKNYLAETRGISPDKISVIINWQNEKEFLDYQENSKVVIEHPFTFMYMGNIGPVAGVDLLIDAFMHVKLDNARLVIAGSGSMKETLMAKAFGCKGIEFWDVPNGKVPDIQSQADVMMLPIKRGAASSSIPSKLPAYMFSAKPIIGCMDEDSDTANAIKEADCGWVIEPENVDKLAETMKMVISVEKTTLNDKAKKSQEYGLAHFSKIKNLSKLTDVIMKQINDNKNE
ncbi:glycosyltransferase WbuB [Bacteroides heparinolyticus]|uniref:Glycosyltransferase WbuB n=1 Tax=Prevotella heparinolytica TaxID=28113 RepID=A0A3P2A1L2_9BACE|nr:glycosyltransferase family 4 protein [Bacteroides heparinolyticus]RRD89311.1 glycosyltransferase WbuB [Bacteroides heparinolyticus]